VKIFLRSLTAFVALEGLFLVAPNILSAPGTAPNPDSCLACSGHSDPLACHRIAVDLASARDYARAVAIEERVFTRMPGNAEVAAALGKMHQDGTKDSARAIRMYHEAMYASPGYPPALYGLGVIMEEKGEMPIALAYFSRGARENPDQPLFRVRLAEVLVASGRPDEARPILDEIVAKWPGSEEATSARTMMNRTSLARP
jgi:tetratricopeptide (TPR) repeat protein